jgi:hypothetical protein
VDAECVEIERGMMMIVSKVKLEFSEAPWAIRTGAGQSARRVLERVTDEVKPVKTLALETMSLGELLYYALMGEGAGV